MLGGAAIARDGSITGWHVTAQPDEILRDIVRGRIFDESHSYRELGPGLYVSAVPTYWLGRLGNADKVIKSLSTTERHVMALAVNDEIDKLSNRGYISKSEAASGHRMISSFLEGNDASLGILSSQPWNIKLSDRQWLKDHGLGHRAVKTTMIEIKAKGRFVEVYRSLRGNEWKRLARNFDGAIKRNSMGQNPEAVIWNVDAITFVGDPEEVT